MKKCIAAILIVFIVFCCACSQPNKIQSSDQNGGSSKLESDLADVQSDEASDSSKFNINGKYICNNDYFKNENHFAIFPEDIPAIAFYEDNSCEFNINYMGGITSVYGIYSIEGKQILVTIYLNDTIFEESDIKYIDDKYIFSIRSDNEIIIDKGFYAVNAGDTFVKSIS